MKIQAFHNKESVKKGDCSQKIVAQLLKENGFTISVVNHPKLPSDQNLKVTIKLYE